MRRLHARDMGLVNADVSLLARLTALLHLDLRGTAARAPALCVLLTFTAPGPVSSNFACRVRGTDAAPLAAHSQYALHLEHNSLKNAGYRRPNGDASAC
jgi:hypothetical protein